MTTSALSSRPRLPVILNYGIAVALVTAAVVVSLGLVHVLAISPSLSLFLCMIMFVAWANGTGPALLAIVLTLLSFDYFFVEPAYAFALAFKDAPRLAIFAVAALLVVSLIRSQRRTADTLQTTVGELQRLNEALRAENTERKRAEEKARLTEEGLRSIIDTIPALVARRAADGSIDFVNQTWRTFTGLFSSENPKHLEVAAFHPEDRLRIEQEWQSHLAEGEAFDTEYRVRAADGEYRWLYVRRVPLRDRDGNVTAWYGVGYDIEDRKRAEAALQATVGELQGLNEALRVENAERKRAEERARLAEQRLQELIDTLPALIARRGADGRINFLNQTWFNYTGLSRDRPEDYEVATFHPEDELKEQQAWAGHIARGEPYDTEYRLRRADGGYRWHYVRRAPLRDADGNVAGWYGVAFDNEDRKRAEDALRRSEAELTEAERELQRTIDTIPVLVATYQPDGMRTFVNKQWLGFSGLAFENAVGETPMLLVHPDDFQEAERGWRASLATGEPLHVEVRVRRADGEYRWHSIRRVPLRDEKGDVIRWYGVGHDIDDQRRAESALQRSEAYLAEAQKLSRTGSFAWDFESKEYFWSDETYKIMGVDRSVKPSVDLVMERVHPDDRAILQHEMKRAAKGAPSQDYEVRLLMPDGEIKHLHVVAHYAKYDNGKEENVGALMDITAAKKSQEALDAAQTALAHASRVATLGEISATIAHEVNQPLAAIVTNGQACLRFLRRETPDLDDVRGAVEWIVKDGNRAAEVIQRVRRLVKKSDAQKAPLDVNDAINEVVALLQRELTAQQVSLRRQLAPAMPLAIADRVQLQQVIINLIMNGVEAMQAVTSRPRALAIQSHRDEADQIVVAVTDSGVGIPVETKGRLFEAFFSTKPSGLGMGLSICRSIIEDHGGRLWATDNSGEPGATFQFALPVHRNNPT